MGTVFAYYSLEGNCRALAEAMSGAVGGTLVEIKPVDYAISQTGVMKYFKGGKGALFKETPELERLDVDWDKAKLIVVGGPVWFGRIAPPVRSFLGQTAWAGRKAAVFAMHRGGKGSAARDMADLIAKAGGEVFSTVNFHDLRNDKAEATLDEAVAWAETMVDQARAF